MISKQVREEIEAFIAAKAPGIGVEFQENPAFDSTTIRLGIKVELTQLVSNQLPDHLVGQKVIEMLADVQKAAVTAIGLEDYVRSRQIEVLEDVREQLRDSASEEHEQ